MFLTFDAAEVRALLRAARAAPARIPVTWQLHDRALWRADLSEARRKVLAHDEARFGYAISACLADLDLSRVPPGLWLDVSAGIFLRANLRGSRLEGSRYTQAAYAQEIDPDTVSEAQMRRISRTLAMPGDGLGPMFYAAREIEALLADADADLRLDLKPKQGWKLLAREETVEAELEPA